MSLLQWLKNIDRSLFLKLNHDVGFVFWDKLMIWTRNPLTWIPLYIGVLVIVFRKCKRTEVFKFIVVSAVTVFITDSLAARVMKPFFERLRPCYEPSLQGLVRILDGCGGRYSLPSNHAANHFGLAVFWFSSVFLISGKRWYWLWIWAAIICYAQVYVGKHYPFDILMGAVTGSCIGLLAYMVFKYWVKKSPGKKDSLDLKQVKV